MPKLLKVSNIGLKGLNTDLLAWELEPQFITDGENFKITNNKIKSANTYVEYLSPGSLVFTARYFKQITSQFATWLIGADDGVYEASRNAEFKVYSLVAGATSIWSSCQIGNIIIISTNDTKPLYRKITDVSGMFLPLPFDATQDFQGKGISAKTIRAHKNFLFGLNLTENGVEQPDAYRWSHPADINGIPFTWDETDPSGLAGRAALGGDGGPIVDGLSLRDSFVIYSRNAIDILDYTGDEFVWRRRELSNTLGILSINCVVEANGLHYFLGVGDVYSNDGTTIKPIMHNRIRHIFNARLNTKAFSKAIVISNESTSEIWICVPLDGSNEINAAFVYNIKEDSWAFESLPINSVYGSYGRIAEEEKTWDDSVGTWDEDANIWGSSIAGPLESSMFFITNDGTIDVVDAGLDGEVKENGECFVERVDLRLGDTETVRTVTALYPKVEGTVPLKISVGSSYIPGGAIEWEEPQTFIPGVDRKVDFRSTGSLHAWRIESSNKGHWAMHGMDFEFEDAGSK